MFSCLQNQFFIAALRDANGEVTNFVGVQCKVSDQYAATVIKQQEDVIAMPNHLENDLAAIQHSLYIKKAGVKLGSIIRNELIPDHELALSNIANKSLKFVEVDREIALQYLRRQELKIDTLLKGWALLTHQQLPLGWIKLLPNRVNNYYPKDWRILNK